jgi:5-methylcytosine-specific restriction endonuclease McrA
MTVKPCRKCGAQDRTKAGRCGPCNRENGRKWYEANTERKAESARQWREDNPEKHAENGREWYKANTDKHLENTRKWQRANPDKVADNRRNWYETNTERAVENARNWQKANPEKVKVIRHNRRAKVKGNGGTLSKGIVNRLMRLQKGNCACGCGANLKKTGHHLDHIMPIARGGTNTDDNIQLLTPKCNRRKSAKDPIEWARENGKLI